MCVYSALGPGDHDEQAKSLLFCSLVGFSKHMLLDSTLTCRACLWDLLMGSGLPSIYPCPIFNPSVGLWTRAWTCPAPRAPMPSVMGGAPPSSSGPCPLSLCPSQLILCAGLSFVLPQPPKGIQTCHLPSSHDMRGDTLAPFLALRNTPVTGA